MDKKTHFRGQSAFSFIELLITLGLLSTVSFSISEMVIRNNKAIKGSQDNHEFKVFGQNIERLLDAEDDTGERTKCTSMLKDNIVSNTPSEAVVKDPDAPTDPSRDIAKSDLVIPMTPWKFKSDKGVSLVISRVIDTNTVEVALALSVEKSAQSQTVGAPALDYKPLIKTIVEVDPSGMITQCVSSNALGDENTTQIIVPAQGIFVASNTGSTLHTNNAYPRAVHIEDNSNNPYSGWLRVGTRALSNNSKHKAVSLKAYCNEAFIFIWDDATPRPNIQSIWSNSTTRSAFLAQNHERILCSAGNNQITTGSAIAKLNTGTKNFNVFIVKTDAPSYGVVISVDAFY